MEDHNVNPGRDSLTFTIARVDLGIIGLACGISAICLAAETYRGNFVLENLQDEVKLNIAFGIMVHPVFLLMITAIWVNLFLISAHEPKPDVKEILKVLWFCQISSLLLMVVSFVGVLFGYPVVDMNNWAHVVFLGKLFAAFIYSLWLEWASTIDVEIFF